MTWTQLSIQEWRRRPWRMGVTTAGIAIAVGALFSLLAFQRGYQAGVHEELEHLGAHVLVVPKGCPFDAASIALHGANWPCYLKERYVDEVRSVPGIATAAPCLMAALYSDNGDQSVYVGVDTNILALKPGWKIQGRFPNGDGELLVGSDIARRHGWKIADAIALPGLSDQMGRVAGVLSATHGADDTFIFLGLADAQERLHHQDEITHVLVRLSDPNGLDQAVAQLRGCDAGLSMNVVPLAHVYHTIQSLANSSRVLLGCIAVIALLIAGTGVGNTILIAVTERTTDIGVMRAIGASRADVFRLVLLETIQVCVSGAIVGIALAFVVSREVENWARATLPFSPNGALIRWSWLIVAGCVVSAVILGIFAGVLPAWRAASVTPITAIRGAGTRS